MTSASLSWRPSGVSGTAAWQVRVNVPGGATPAKTGCYHLPSR
ncbi:hypothetical protein [Sporisorium scitamineum]|uniref:Uncharacterized protein n=1 Tax=Sporisorium scitamineum TaxID=49012 RepID=A0A0F7RXJ3_9BASI|nr:hypothetical protein [Sporisorium scitamineum]